MGAADVLPLPVPLPARRWSAGAPLCRALQNAVVESMTSALVKSVDDIPAVCLEDDLLNIFRLSRSDMRFWRRMPDLLPFPPLPPLDRQIRVSGCVVAWFLAQEAREYYRSFRSPLEELTKGTRRNRPPW